MRPERTKLLYLAPALAWIFAMVLFPLFYTIGISFFNYTLGGETEFNYGLNYLTAVQDYRFWNGLKVSAVFTVVVVSIEFLLGLGLALLLSGRMRGRRTLRLIMLMPLFACPIAVGYLYLMIFHQRGPVNAFLSLLGFVQMPNWLGDPSLTLFTVGFVDVWGWTSFMFLILLAAIESLPVELYEAAQIDGASGWLKFRKLTFPMLIPAILIALALRITDAFKIFDIFVGLTKGGPGISTEVYSMYVYRVTLEYFKFGYSGALSVIFLLIMMAAINVLFLFRRLRKW